MLQHFPFTDTVQGKEGMYFAAHFEYRENLFDEYAGWCFIGDMITSASAEGYYVGNKVKIIDLVTKKEKFLLPEEWAMFKDETGQIVPALVSKELWDLANDVLKKRSDDVKNGKVYVTILIC